MIDNRDIAAAAREALIQASTRFRDDQLDAYRSALLREQDEKSRWVLEQTIQNAETAARDKLAICDDTGIPHVLVRMGREAEVNGGFLSAIQQGIAAGLSELPGRPMAVKGEGLDLLGQSLGMFDDPAMLASAPVCILEQPGKALDITVLMLGGGPEIRGKTQRIFHKHDGMNVIDEVTGWIAEEVGKLGCTPTVPFIGIGRTHYEAASLMLQAMAEADFTKQSDIERHITTEVNKTGVGSLGLGGSLTSLASFVKIGPQRASGVRIVSLRLGCSIDPRKHTVTLQQK